MVCKFTQLYVKSVSDMAKHFVFSLVPHIPCLALLSEEIQGEGIILRGYFNPIVIF